MKRYYPALFIVLIVCSICSSGCATVLTHTYPPVTETKQGESIPGDKVGYTYLVEKKQDSIVLMKQPLCREKIQRTEVKKKQLHGVIGAVLEIPLFGLGILDLVTAGVYTQATMEEYPIDPIPGPMISPCGDFEPAPDKSVVVQYPDSLVSKDLQTRGNGHIDIADIRPEGTGETRLTIFVRDSDGLHYVKSLDRYGW